MRDVRLPQDPTSEFCGSCGMTQYDCQCYTRQELKEMDVAGTWRTKEGEEIPIAQLTDSHLLNILRYLMRAAPSAHALQLQDAMEVESIVTAEIASSLAEDRVEHLLQAEPEAYYEHHPQWDELQAEAERRGLRWWEAGTDD